MGNLSLRRSKKVTNNDENDVSRILEKLRQTRRTREECELITKTSLERLCVLFKRCLFEDIIMFYDDEKTDDDRIIFVDDEDGETFYMDWTKDDNAQIVRGQDCCCYHPLSSFQLMMNFRVFVNLLYSNSNAHPYVTCYVLYKLWEADKLDMDFVGRLDQHLATTFLKVINNAPFETTNLESFIVIFDCYYTVKWTLLDFNAAKAEFAVSRSIYADVVVDGDHTYAVVK